jgi:hypothetical protein
MAIIIESPVFATTFEEVNVAEPVLGGQSPLGPINRHARILGSRTLWLKQHVETLEEGGLRFYDRIQYNSASNPLLVQKEDQKNFINLTGSNSFTLELINAWDAGLTTQENADLCYDEGRVFIIKNNCTSINGVKIALQTGLGGNFLFDDATNSQVLFNGDTMIVVWKLQSSNNGTYYKTVIRNRALVTDITSYLQTNWTQATTVSFGINGTSYSTGSNPIRVISKGGRVNFEGTLKYSGSVTGTSQLAIDMSSLNADLLAAIRPRVAGLYSIKGITNAGAVVDTFMYITTDCKFYVEPATSYTYIMDSLEYKALINL